MINPFGWVIMIVMIIILIAGGYQLYFLPQKKNPKAPSEFQVRWIDRVIPFRPGWVWIYSGLYYPVLIGLVFTVQSFQDFCYTVFSFILLLVLQVLCFFVFPVKTPEFWRQFELESTKSRKALKFVQNIDAATNCFPSMHCSVAMLTAMHLFDFLNGTPFAYLAFLFPVLIGISTLFTKQHYFIDIPAGILLGGLVYFVFTLYAV